jgi:hypothetical protein
MVARLQSVIPPGLDPYESVLQLSDEWSNARQLLRQMAINRSVLGRLESLLAWASNPFAQQLGQEGLDLFTSSRSIELADRANLDAMDERQLATFLARLGSAVGDTLSPDQTQTVRHILFEATRRGLLHWCLCFRHRASSCALAAKTSATASLSSRPDGCNNTLSNGEIKRSSGNARIGSDHEMWAGNASRGVVIGSK